MYVWASGGRFNGDWLPVFVSSFLCVAWSVRNSSHCCQYSLKSDINNTSDSTTPKELPRNSQPSWLLWASKHFTWHFGGEGRALGRHSESEGKVGRPYHHHHHHHHPSHLVTRIKKMEKKTQLCSLGSRHWSRKEEEASHKLWLPFYFSSRSSGCIKRVLNDIFHYLDCL